MRNASYFLFYVVMAFHEELRTGDGVTDLNTINILWTYKTPAVSFGYTNY